MGQGVQARNSEGTHLAVREWREGCCCQPLAGLGERGSWQGDASNIENLQGMGLGAGPSQEAWEEEAEEEGRETLGSRGCGMCE